MDGRVDVNDAVDGVDLGLERGMVDGFTDGI